VARWQGGKVEISWLLLLSVVFVYLLVCRCSCSCVYALWLQPVRLSVCLSVCLWQANINSSSCHTCHTCHLPHMPQLEPLNSFLQLKCGTATPTVHSYAHFAANANAACQYLSLFGCFCISFCCHLRFAMAMLQVAHVARCTRCSCLVIELETFC